MACETEQQSIPMMEITEPINEEERRISVETEFYDEESRKLLKRMAQQDALRQLEQRKTQALASAHRMSFLR